MTEHKRHPIITRMAVRFAAVIFGVVLTVALSAWLQQQRLDESRKMAHIVNMAGRQRALMRGLHVNVLALPQTSGDATARLQESMARDAVTARRKHAWLSGVSAGADESRTVPSDLVAAYTAELNPVAMQWLGFLNAVEQLAGLSDPTGPAGREWSAAALAAVQHDRVIESLDRGAAAAATIADRRIGRLGDFLWLLTAAQFSAMAFGVIFVVVPLIRRVGVSVGVLERERQAAASQVARLFDMSRDIIAMSGPDRRFRRVNPAMVRLLGYSAEELCSRPVTDFVHPDDASKLLEISAEMRGGDSGGGIEFRCRFRTKQGGWRLLAWSASLDTDSQVILGIARDITDEAAAQEALARNLGELERSNRSLDEFAYAASHDLKTPLRDVANLSAWIAEDLGEGLSPATRRHVDMLQQRVQRMDELLDDLLRYARSGRADSDLETFDLAELVDRVVQQVGVPSGFTVCTDLAVGHIRTVRVPLEQVLRNLIANAVKHHDRPDGRIDISAKVDGLVLKVIVADDGPGIEPAYHERIFRMFQTLRTPSERGGSGIGLALVRKTVEGYGGAVSLHSQAGEGAQFEFTWVLVDGAEKVEERGAA